MDKQLKDKAIDFKGKAYVLVADRVIYFNETYPEGSITTELISEPNADTVIIKATVKPNDKQIFTGYSQATWGEGYINKTSALENAETSAVGRALAFMGIGVIESIASIDEINKTTTTKEKTPLKDFDNSLDEDLKQEIIKKSKELYPEIKTEIFKDWIKTTTGEEFKKENFNKIIDKLDVLIAERL